MRIRIENIGPVKKIDIDLSKPLIIFTGLNGTGKTYVSYVLYTLCNMFIYKRDDLDWKKFCKSPQKERKGTIDIDKLYKILQTHLKIMNGILNVAFGVKFNDELIKNTQLTLLSTKVELRKDIMSENFVINADEVFDFIKEKDSLEYTLINRGGDLEDTTLVNYIVVKSLLFNTLIEDIEPSDRSGLSTFNKEINLELETIVNKGDFSSNMDNVRQPLAISRFMSDLKDHLKPTNEKSQYGYLADEIEKEIMCGHLTVSESGDVCYRKDSMDKEIPLALSSSGVKTICSIILFLRYSAMASNLIIIDEPEINLHPKNQVLIARVISKIVNSGIKLIINTHSDYIIREINNMIMLSSIKDEKKIKELGYSKDEILESDIVCPYYFEIQKNESGVIGKEIEVTKTGFSIDLIDQVINDQVETGQRIYEEIEGL